MKKHMKTGLLVLGALLIICTGIYGISIAGVTGTVTSFTVSPDPVKLGSSASVQYAINTAGKVAINVLNSNGDIVRNLLEPTSKNIGTWVQTWDGRDIGGAIVPDGSYKFVIEEKDSTGAVIGSGDITKTCAVNPSISNFMASPGTINPAVGEKTSISYSLASNSLVTVKILNGLTPVKTVCSNVYQNAGSNSIEWDGTDSTGTKFVGDGTYTYQIDAVSPTVATFKDTQKGTVIVEKEAPQIPTFSASPNPLKLGVNTLSISYSVSEPVKVTMKVYDANNNVVRTLLDAVSKAAGSATVSWDGNNEAASLVPEGSYNVVINAVDNFNKSSGDKTVAITAGIVPVINNAVASPSPFNPNAGSTSIDYSLSNRAVVTVQILNGYTTLRTLTNNATLEAGAQSVAWDGKDSTAKVVSDGSYTFQITAKSTVVSTFSTIYKGTVVVDKGTMSITGLAASPNPMKLGVNNLSISYTVSDTATIYASVYNGTTLIKDLAAGVSKAAGAVSHTWDGIDQSGKLVNDGNYTVTVCAVGISGKAATATVPFAAGYVPAVTALSSTPEPYNPTSGASVTINFTISSPANVKLSILQGSTTVRTLSLAGLNVGQNTATWDGKDSSATPKTVADGPYTYKIEATSPVVNTFTGSNTGTLNVNGASPTVTSLSVTPSTVKIGTPATLRYTVSEPATIKAQIVDSLGQPVKTFPDESKPAGSFSISWDTNNNTGGPVSTGSYTLKIIAIDADKLEGTAQMGFQVGKVPTISGVTANPPNVDLSKGESSTTISYSVDVESFVTIKALDAYGKFWKNICINKKVYGTDSVVMSVYQNGIPMTGNLGYTIDASSAIGYFRAQQVSGTVSVGGKVSGEVNCAECHQGFPLTHRMTNCFGCHGNDEPIQNCAACHSGYTHPDGSKLTKYQCSFCHNDLYKAKIPAGHGPIGPLHDTALGADCQKCHNQNLSVEHPLHKDVNGVAYDCSTCHSSTARQTVKDAVYNKQKDCTACHGTANHQAVHQLGTPYALDANCTTCHINNLVDEHLTNTKTQSKQDPNYPNDPTKTVLKGWTCDTCHASTNAVVVGAIATNNTQCAACHRTGHGLGFTENVLADIPLYQNVADAAYPNGYIWSPPQDAFIWAGESWMPDEYIVGGKLVMSSRRTDVVAQDVYNYYFGALTTKGWLGVSAEPSFANNFFDVTFTKDIHKAKVMFYGGAYHDATPVVSGGYRIEILYK